ncbi:MAG: FKBP-type peptidyl-prolyl cis-trans isomerase, partial [Phycisphaerae bacterium]
LGQPLHIQLGRMISGWGEGLATMKVGGKRRLEIPFTMGFGEKGQPPRVPPKATLIYEVELLDVGY